MEPKSQVETIDALIEETSDAVKEHIIFNSYRSLSQESKNNLRWIIAKDMYDEGADKLGVVIDYLSGLVVDGYSGLFGK